MRLTFLGATQTVTGSKFLLEAGGRRLLIDCGVFQGLKELRLRNWAAPPVDPASVHAVILTHAHIDHTGYLPRFMKQGFRGPVYATPATVDLARILLPDSGHLQEEEARYRNKHRLSKHKPAMPLYTMMDAEESLRLFKSVPYRKPESLAPALSFTFFPAGHILGSAFVLVREGDEASGKTILFTGDIGRYGTPIVVDPSPIKSADYLVLESTYGYRLHEDRTGETGKEQLRRIINETSQRGGTVLIPSFAVGRAQEILYALRELEEEEAIPTLPVYVDSPMAVNAFEIYSRHDEEHDVEMSKIMWTGTNPLHTRNAIRGAETGGLIGGILGWVAGISTLTLPGVGAFLAAGPLVSALGGAVAGGVVGGLAGGSGAIHPLGLPRDVSSRIEERLRDGDILISVQSDDPVIRERAVRVFKAAGAEDIFYHDEEAAA